MGNLKMGTKQNIANEVPDRAWVPVPCARFLLPVHRFCNIRTQSSESVAAHASLTRLYHSLFQTPLRLFV